jgi:hypothetical protein
MAHVTSHNYRYDKLVTVMPGHTHVSILVIQML